MHWPWPLRLVVKTSITEHRALPTCGCLLISAFCSLAKARHMPVQHQHPLKAGPGATRLYVRPGPKPGPTCSRLQALQGAHLQHTPSLHAQVVLNAGVWGGKAAAVHAVLGLMVAELDRLYSRMLAAGPLQVRNFDMAVLNTAALGAGARDWRIALGPPFCGGQASGYAPYS